MVGRGRHCNLSSDSKPNKPKCNRAARGGWVEVHGALIFLTEKTLLLEFHIVLYTSTLNGCMLKGRPSSLGDVKSHSGNEEGVKTEEQAE